MPSPIPMMNKGWRLFIDQFDVGNNLTEITTGYEAAEVDVTCAGAADGATSIFVPGLISFNASMKAIYQGGAAAAGIGQLDTIVAGAGLVAGGQLGSEVKRVITFCTGKGFTNVAARQAMIMEGTFSQSSRGSMTPGAAITMDYKMIPMGGAFARGKFVYDGTTTGPETSAEQTIQAIPADANAFLVASVHILSFTGTNISAVIKSGAGLPTTRATVGPFSGVGSGHTTVLGPIADTAYGVQFTGTYTSVRAIVAIAFGRK